MDKMEIGFNRVSEVGNEIRYIKNAIARKHISGSGLYTENCNNIKNARKQRTNTFLFLRISKNSINKHMKNFFLLPTLSQKEFLGEINLIFLSNFFL